MQKIGVGPSHKAPLVVLFLWPGIGKENMKAVHRIVANHFFKNVQRVMFNDIKVLQVVRANLKQNAAHAGLVDFNSQIIYVGIFLGDLNRRRAHSKAYFNYDWIGVSKNLDKVQGLFFVWNAILVRKLVVGLFLSRRHPAGPHDVGLYRAIKRIAALAVAYRIRRRLLLVVIQVHQAFLHP